MIHEKFFSQFDMKTSIKYLGQKEKASCTCLGTVRLKKWVWDHSTFLTSLKLHCLKWPTFGIFFLLILIHVNLGKWARQETCFNCRHFFKLSTFSLHLIFVPWVAEKVVKTLGAGVSTWPPPVWPCHTLSLAVSSFTGQSRVGIGTTKYKKPMAQLVHYRMCCNFEDLFPPLWAVISQNNLDKRQRWLVAGRDKTAYHLYGAIFSFPSYSSRIMVGMHKEYLAHIDMIYSPPGRKVGCKKRLNMPISMASPLYENSIEWSEYSELENSYLGSYDNILHHIVSSSFKPNFNCFS